MEIKNCGGAVCENDLLISSLESKIKKKDQQMQVLSIMVAEANKYIKTREIEHLDIDAKLVRDKIKNLSKNKILN